MSRDLLRHHKGITAEIKRVRVVRVCGASLSFPVYGEVVNLQCTALTLCFLVVFERFYRFGCCADLVDQNRTSL